jgi:hypothetical protein
MFSLLISRRYPLTARFNNARSLKSLLASQDGLPCDFPELAVEIVTNYGATRKLRFFYDTGADHMVIPVYVARREGIRYREDYPGNLGSSVGGNVRCYYDFVQARSSLSGRTHRWVCGKRPANHGWKRPVFKPGFPRWVGRFGMAFAPFPRKSQRFPRLPAETTEEPNG